MSNLKSKTLLQSILDSPNSSDLLKQKTNESLNWYRNKIKNRFSSKTILHTEYFDKKNYPNKPIFGNIVAFKYSPKNEQTLKYYDRFPLVLILKVVPGGFIGLNFHYLHPIHRAYFMDAIYDYSNNQNNYKLKQINIKYNTFKISSRLRYYKPCIKKYLNSNISTIFYTFLPEEWDLALFLPTEQFVKERKETVWKESEDLFD